MRPIGFQGRPEVLGRELENFTRTQADCRLEAKARAIAGVSLRGQPRGATNSRPQDTECCGGVRRHMLSSRWCDSSNLPRKRG